MLRIERWVISGILLVSLLAPVFCHAAVTGNCSTCHTMHNSQDGVPVAYRVNILGETETSEVPFGNLLKTDCLGCHTSASAETIVEMGGTQVPIILNLSEPTYPPDGSSTSTLAGGNFHWLVGQGDAYGHNVYGIADVDPRFPATHAPGGVERTGECINCHATLSSASSGCKGCHVPEHHAGGGNVVADMEQGWYRFLGSVMLKGDSHELTTEGVAGIEAPDWEQNPVANQHNTYQGSTGAYASYLESGSINQKCVGCHGEFHSETTANMTWIRHPVDVAIPNAGEYTGFTTYDPMTPVSRGNVSPADVNFSEILHGSDQVGCISCHRPHGSPYPAMLRWAYRDWPGIDEHTQQPAVNGCGICHTDKS